MVTGFHRNVPDKNRDIPVKIKFHIHVYHSSKRNGRQYGIDNINDMNNMDGILLILNWIINGIINGISGWWRAQ